MADFDSYISTETDWAEEEAARKAVLAETEEEEAYEEEPVVIRLHPRKAYELQLSLENDGEVEIGLGAVGVTWDYINTLPKPAVFVPFGQGR